MEVMCGPLLQSLQNRLELNKLRVAKLQQEKEHLENELDHIQHPQITLS